MKNLLKIGSSVHSITFPQLRINDTYHQKANQSLISNESLGDSAKNKWTTSAACYIDYLFYPTPMVNQYHKTSGLKNYFMGFIGTGMCNGDVKACWGGEEFVYNSMNREIYKADVTVSQFVKYDIDSLRKNGGNIVFSFGGMLIPIESSITNTKTLVDIYNQTISNYKLDAFDFRFDKSFLTNNVAVARHIDVMEKVKMEHEHIKISYTLPIGKEQELTGGFNDIGISFLNKLYEKQLHPTLINGFIKSTRRYDETILFEETKEKLLCMHSDIANIWKNWGDKTVWEHVGVCPMFGKNPNGKIYTIEDQKKLIEWANNMNIACLNGWDTERDYNPDDFGLMNHTPGQFCQILSEYNPVEVNIELTGEV
jgi:hypothetical protein